MSEEVIAALKLADRGGGHRDYADILAEAVRELAWMAAGEKDYEHGSDDEKRWVANYQFAEDIINGL